MHERLRTHAESVAFFGGGMREKAVSYSYFAIVLFIFKCLLVLWLLLILLNVLSFDL